MKKTIESHLHPQPQWAVAKHEIPNGREEIWRFTPIRKFAPLFEVQESSELSVIVSGAELTEISMAELEDFAPDLAPVDRLSAAALANSKTIKKLSIPAESQNDQPIHLKLSGSAQQLAHQTLVIEVGANSQSLVVLEHSGSAVFGSLIVVKVGDGAQFNLVSLQDWADDAIHGGQVGIMVGRDAHVRTVSVSLGGEAVRLAENALFAGTGGKIEQFGLYFADSHQHIEHRLFVDHNQPNTHSNVDYRGALQGKGAHTVWIGDVLIRAEAEGISTYEANKNLVLTDGCQADSVPNLEIETGQIEGAGHSSTTGRFDDEQLFYLRSRGISESEARRLVVRGFFVDIIRRIGVPSIEEAITAAIEKELEGVEL